MRRPRQQPPRWSIPLAAVLLLGTGGLLACHGCAEAVDSSSPPLCTEGENIFCRCPGGDPGTKECEPGGAAFSACGPCAPRPSSSGAGGGGTSSGQAGGPAGGAGGVGGAGGGAPPGDGPLLSSCSEDGDCQSGVCRFRVCTKGCKLVSDCPFPDSECVPLPAMGETLCLPTCDTAVDCAPYQAPPSMCGFTQAVDNWDVTVCADWADKHQLVPDGTDCLPFDHAACNLGYTHRQKVCTAQGVCATGCMANIDCPDGTSCSGNGNLGTCG